MTQTQFVEGVNTQSLSQASYGEAVAAGSLVGTATSAADQTGKSRRQVVDALGRVRRVDEPNDSGDLGGVNAPAQPTYYDYDTLDNLLRVEQSIPAQVTQYRYFKYDSLSRLTAERQPEQDAPHALTGAVLGNTQWSRVVNYLADGRVSSSLDARSITTSLAYDGLNRVQSVNHSDTAVTPDVTYTYDEARAGYYNRGQLTSVVTGAIAATPTSHAIPATKQEYDHDRLSQIAAQRTTIGGTLYGQSYTYGGLGNLKSQTYPSGRVVNYGYDGTGRLTSVADNLAGATQSYLSGASYYAHGGVQQETWGNSAIQAVEFNARLQPTAINLERSGNLLQRYEYKYGQVNIDTGASDALNNGQVGRVDAFIGKNGTTPIKQWEQRFTYDKLGRLSRAREVRSDTNQSVWQQHYTYDRFGNRYQAPAGTAGQYNEGVPWLKVEAADINPQTNRYTIPNISYDAAGQITQDTYHRNSKYTYDANGRVRSWMRPDNTNLRTNVIDGAGQRVRSIANSFSTTSIYDVFGRLSAEYDSRQPSLRAENIYRGAGGTLLAVRTTSTKLLVGGGYGVSVQWVLSDLAGSTRLTSGASGAVIARRDYTPFGEELTAGVGGRDNLQGYGVSFSARHGFAQTERDEAIELEHTPWRKLDSKAGRWTTPDPYLGSMSVGDPQSFNRYAYVNNDPVNLVDPSGLNASSGMWTPGVGGYGCDASYGSCGGGWDGSGGGGGMGGYGFSGGLFDSERFNPGSAGEAAYAQRLQNTYDAIDANRALQQFIRSEGTDAGAQARFLALMTANPTLSLQIRVQELELFIRVPPPPLEVMEMGVSARAIRLAINALRGRVFERAVIEALGATKNRTVVSVPGLGRSIPDLLRRGISITEIKNVASISFTRQLRIQAEAAAREGISFNLIISPSTQYISSPLLQAVGRTGGSVMRFNPTTGALTRVPF